jgi:aryl-alcohol dehydrogenase-like predicted oxidoreductase
MEYTEFGKTGMRVSVAGLGCGGGSRLGKNRGMSKAESVALVRTAMDLGVNYLDTAHSYTTEDIVGEAIKAVPRDKIYVGTKSMLRVDGKDLTPADVVASLDNSLGELQTDYVDVFQFHGVPPAKYDEVLNDFVPVLLKEKEKGKLRFLGFTETPPNDPNQEVLQRAEKDDVWEAIMLGFHMMHQNARKHAFPYTQRKGIGTLLMFVVRGIFSIPGKLQGDVKELVADGKLPQWLAEKENPLDFLIHEGGATSIIDAAYRYARHEPGADIILFGTGSVEHMKTNVASILAPPLPKADTDRLADLFGHLYGVGLDLPVKRTG